MYSADGDMLIVPQEGMLHVTTEFGRLTVGVKEICVIPRGVKFSIDHKKETPEEKCARGDGSLSAIQVTSSFLILVLLAQMV
jgi:homogentisate 1,2-dioxygenase